LQFPPSTRAVHEALTTHPGATAPELADHAGVGGSTARNALRVLEKAGLATRVTPIGTGRREADIWDLPPARPASLKSIPGTKNPGATTTATRPIDAPAATSEPSQRPTEEPGTPSAPDAPSAIEPTTDQEPRTEDRIAEVDSRVHKITPQELSKDHTPVIEPADAAPPTMPEDGLSADAADDVPVQSITSVSALEPPRARPVVTVIAPTTAHSEPDNSGDQPSAVVLDLPVGKLAKGQLQQLVLDAIRTKPQHEWSIGDVWRILHRSQGAIANALERFAQNGVLDRCHDAPRRYRLNASTSEPAVAIPAEAEPAAAPDPQQ